MQTQQLWPTRADRTCVQACMESACKEQIRAHKGLVNVSWVNVDFVPGYVCGNMYSAPGKACAGEIVCGSPSLLLCSTGWQSGRVSPLPRTQLLDHCRSPQMCSSTVSLGTVLRHRVSAPPPAIRSGKSDQPSCVPLLRTGVHTER